MARDIAHGEIKIGVDLEKVGAELTHAEAQFQRAMNNIDRMKGEAELGVKSAELDRKIHEVKKELKLLDAMSADPEVGLDTKELDREIAAAHAKLKALNEEKAELTVDTKELKAANRELRISEQRQAAMAKRWLETRRNAEKFQAEQRRGLAAQQKALDLDRKRAVELEKLRLQYIKLHDEIEKGSRAKMFDFFGDETARTRFRQTEAELKNVRDRIIEIGGRDTDFKKLELASDSAGTRLRRMASSLGAVRLHLGFFSASLKQAAIGFTALGPVIFGLAGQLVSLVGVLGTGLTGALAVAGAGIGGFALSALGVGLILKPMIGDLQDAMKASKAYGDAVRKYGRDSSQAATAQEKLNSTLGDVGPQVRQAFAALGGMSDRWGRLTSSARPMFFDTMAHGIRAANKLMPMFARESVRAFSVAGRETQKWIDMVSGPEAQQGIKDLMSNFTAALPALSAGFRSLTAMLSRVSVSASKLLPSLTSGFKDWARSFEESVGSGFELDQKISRLVDHMRQVGHFAQSAGRMLAAFFNAGANEGSTLLTTLTNIFDRWTAWMNSADGQRGLAEFFSQANRSGSQFVQTLTTLGTLLFEFSQSFTPLSQGFLSVFNAVSGLASALMGLQGAQAVVTAIGGALAGAFVAGKLMAAAQALAAIGAAIRAIGVGSAALSLASLVNPITALGAVIGVGIAAFSMLKTQADAASEGLDGLSDSISRTTAMIASLGESDAEQAAAKLALLAAQNAYRESVENTRRTLNQYGRGSREYRQALVQEKQALSNVQQANITLNQAQRQTARDRKQVHEAAKRDHEEAIKLVSDLRKAADETALDKISSGLAGFLAKNPGKMVDGFKDLKEAIDGGASRAELLAQAIQLAADAERNLTNEAATRARSRLNSMRADLQGAQAQTAILRDIGSEWSRLEKTLPKRGQRAIALMDPREATQAIRLADRLTQAGQGGLVNRILNPRDLEGSLAGLRQLDAFLRGVGRRPIRPKVEPDTKPAEKTLNGVRRDAEGRPIRPKVDPDTKPAEKKIVRLRKSGEKVNLQADVKTDRANRQLDSISRRGRGREVNINTKADTKKAEADIGRLTRKQGQARVRVTADPSQANATINRVAGRRIPPKRVQITANAESASKAIDKLAGQKIPAKKMVVHAQTGAAEAANRKVQGFRDKTVRLIVQADTSGASAAQAAINAIPSNTNKYITTVHRTRRESAQGSAPDDPMPRPTLSAGPRVPAADRRNSGTAAQAQTRQRRPGIYKRPTLLVGEERQDEYVIATNPSYRSANEGYLEEAAARFGYRLAPIEGAAKGKQPPRKRGRTRIPSAGTVGRGTQNYIRDARQRYTYLRGEINRLTSQSSDEQADQDLRIRAGLQSGYRYPPITNPLDSALGMYGALRRQIQRMIRGGQKSIRGSARVDRSITAKTLAQDKKAMVNARKAEARMRRQEPRDKGGKKASKKEKKEWRKKMQAAERATRAAERRWENNKQRDRDAKQNVRTQQQTVGDLWRELNQQIPSEEAGLRRQLEELSLMKQGLIEGPTGGADSTPMGVQMGALDKARYEAFQQFAGNVGAPFGVGAPGGGLPGGNPLSPPRSPSFYSGRSGGLPGGPAALGGGAGPAGAGSPGPGGTVVNQTINMQEPPPDPHSFSKQLGWEAAALLG